MEPGEVYWSLIEPICDLLDIYEGPDVFLDSYAKAPRAARLLYAAHFCQSEICNGGFHQFFNNSTGVLAPEALEGFRVIGQNEVAAIVKEAMSILGQDYIRERKARQQLLNALPDEHFEHLNRRFFKAIETDCGGFAAAADQFAAHIAR